MDDQKLTLTNDNGSWIPEVLEQVLVAGNCGVGGHFRFQNNGGNCLMCQRDSQTKTRSPRISARGKPKLSYGIRRRDENRNSNIHV